MLFKIVSNYDLLVTTKDYELCAKVKMRITSLKIQMKMIDSAYYLKLTITNIRSLHLLKMLL